MTLVKDNSVQAINTALLSVKRDISVLTATKSTCGPSGNTSSGSTDETTAGLEPGKTYNINISGNAATATRATSATTAETATTANKVANALTVNGKTYNGSEAVDAGVQTVANGGTGATDAASGFNTLADGVRDSSTPRDDEKMLLKPTGAWYKTTCLDFWNYIKGKISSVLGLTKDNYGGKAATAGTADKATSDANGNNIVNTYATKTDIKNTTTKTFDLNTVSSYTTKYIKLGTFHWSDNNSLICELYGNNFYDKVNINILNGNTNIASVCGYYSTNSRRTQAIIVKSGDSWSSDIEIYLQVVQETTLSINVTIDERYQDKINISESTTAPSGKLETLTFNNYNGMFTGNIDANNLTRIKYADYTTEDHTFSSMADYMGIDLSKFGPDVREDNVLSFMVIHWSSIPVIAQAGWAATAGSSGLRCQLHPFTTGTGHATIRCVYLA